MKVFRKALVGIFVLLMVQGSVWGQKEHKPLPKDAPERAQLIAMGFFILKEEAGNIMTTATSPSGAVIGISKIEDRTALGRFFIRQENLTPDEELRLLRKVNDINLSYYLQVVLLPRQIMFTAYLHGAHNTQDFARAMNHLELIPAAVFNDDELLELLNGKRKPASK